MDATYAIVWLFIVFVIGVLSIPVTFILFNKFADKGYGLSHSIGILGTGYFTFLLASFHILPFTITTITAVIVAYTLLNIVIFLKHPQTIIEGFKLCARGIVVSQSLFIAGYLLWAYVRAHQPDINGLEKFMDYGFVNAILRSEYFPPTDMWFAGEPINYYWFGHYITAFLTKLTSIPSSVTYNLMLATILGSTLSGVFSLVATGVSSIKKINPKVALAAGIISSILVVFGGNFHTHFFIIRQNILPLCESDTSSVECKDYWYPDATRFIGYDPETEDKTIHEFPLYSFVVSDLHAHLINLPFVIAYMSLLLNYLLHYKDERKNLLRVVPLGILIGVFIMTNTWDVANYLLLTGIAFISVALNSSNKWSYGKLLQIMMTGFAILGIIVFFGFITSYPFTRNFVSIAQGVDFVNAHTPVWQLLVLWGFPLLLTVVFTTALLRLKIKQLQTSDIFILSLLLTSWILILIPEIIYVKDIYIASHHRANTMFKLTYQAFVMSYIASGYIAVRTISLVKMRIFKALFAIAWGVIFVSLLEYPRLAISSYYSKLSTYKGLAGDMWLQNQYPHEFEVVEWFNKNVKGSPVIVEASGDSYTDFNVISAYTGLPTVSGWYVHEWLWRGDSSFPQNRVNDISVIYENNNIETVRNLINKYEVEYIIVGTLERQKYTNLSMDIFEKIGEQVFVSGETKVYKIYK